MSGVMHKYSDQWWAMQPPTVVRCKGTSRSRDGDQCRRQAIAGSVVCKYHGGAAPQVRRRAAERIMMAADDAASKLVVWMNDEKVDIKVRVDVAKDLLNRAGLGAKNDIKVGIELKPWEKLDEDLTKDMGIVYDLDDVIDAEVLDDAIGPLEIEPPRPEHEAPLRLSVEDDPDVPSAAVINLNPPIPVHLRTR